MTIIVEDGSCVEGANSYNSEELITTFLSVFVELDNYSASEVEKAVVQGSAFLHLKYGSRLRGVRKCANSLFLDFPRNRLYNENGVPIQGIPKEVKMAALWATLVSLLGDSVQGSLQKAPVSEVEIDGLLSVDFSSKDVVEKGEDYRGLIMGNIETLMSGFTEGPSGTISRVVRAF